MRSYHIKILKNIYITFYIHHMHYMHHIHYLYYILYILYYLFILSFYILLFSQKYKFHKYVDILYVK